MPLERLLEDAIYHAQKNGVLVTQGQQDRTQEELDELRDVPGFAETYLFDGVVPKTRQVLKQLALGNTLARLAEVGLNDMFDGLTAQHNARYLEAVGSPLRLADFKAYRAKQVLPLQVSIGAGTLFNMPPPTQGISSLMILALFDRLRVTQGESFDHIHGLVETTKQAFTLRNAYVTDLEFMDVDPNDWLDSAFLDTLADNIDAKQAMEWPQPTKPGDTIWMGAIDSEGCSVSFIQSIYWEYGSGVVVSETGVLFQNRGHGFTLEEGHPNILAPGKRPFHTLNPAMAQLDDGRTMVYGNMGGEGQPQTQAAVFSRYAMFDQPLQQAVTAPRWLLGRTWGENSTTLKLENRFEPELIQALKDAGHVVDMVEPFTSIMGHAGAVVRHASGVLEGVTDPRSDGGVSSY